MISFYSSLLGFLVVAIRATQALRAKAVETKSIDRERVSVLIPARNEEQNIGTLLSSLQAVEDVELEVIVIDDGSRDRTAAIVESIAASDSRIRLIKGQPRPEGWSGKNWACSQGAKAATGEWFLFTDADTTHRPQGLQQTLSLMKENSLDLSSAIPFHRCVSWWEKLLGPFHFLVLVSSAAFLHPKRKQLFAIGQFLLFRRDSYFKQGGHEAIRASLADDLDLANACLEAGGRYGVERTGKVFDVRMYSSFNDFIQGWRRIFRLGFAHANVLRVAEIYFVIACVMMNFKLRASTIPEIGLGWAAILILIFSQRKYGQFSFLGPVLMPFSLGIFVFITILSAMDRLLKRNLIWRGRSYKSTVAQRH